MRFYPFGSSSLNQIYFSSIATTASVADYARSASFGTRAITASYTFAGVPGVIGLPGSCSYLPGATGVTGQVGRSGEQGGTSVAYPSGSQY